MPTQMDWNGTDIITLYHGTTNPALVPKSRGGRVSSDFGQGFYLTSDFDLACEWAISKLNKPDSSYVYEYEVELSKLALFDFYNIKRFRALYWVAQLLQNRLIDECTVTKAVQNFLLTSFKADTDSADVIKGPRADDFYFSFARAFAQNQLDVNLLDFYLENGDIGAQYCFQTHKGLEALQFRRCHTLNAVSYERYCKVYFQRDLAVRNELDKFLESTATHPVESTTLFRFMADWARK